MPPSSSVLFGRLIAKARLRQLQLLSSIGELHNLQQAADAVGMSQPAATHALAELEALLGMPMFERHARGMRPTPAGRALLAPIRRALRAMQDASEAVATMQGGATQLVRVGAIEAGIGGLLAFALPRFAADHPCTVVETTQVERDTMLDIWDSQALDLLLCRAPPQLPAGARYLDVASDRYCVVCDPAHPLAGQTDVPLHTLATQRWLMPPPRSIATHDFNSLWDTLQVVPPQCWISGRTLMLSLAVVRSQRLLWFAPVQLLRQLLDLGLVVEVDCAVRQALPPIGVLYRSDALAGNRVLRDLLERLGACGDLGMVLPD